MKEKEAIAVLKMIEAHGSLPAKAKEMSIAALEEMQQYRTIGTVEYLKTIKENNGYYSLSEAREVSDTALEHIEQMYQWALLQYPEGYIPEVEKLLKEVQYDIMKFAIAVELAEEEYYD